MTDRVDISKPAVSIRSEIADLKKPSGVAGEAVLRAETPGEQQNIIGVNKTNWVINGDFQVWQQGTTGTATNGFTKDSADRWWSVRGALNQETDAHGNPYAHVVCGDYADSAYIQTKVENPERFAGKWLTYQFEIKSDEGLNDGYIYTRNYSTGNAWQNHVLEGFQYGSSWKKFVVTWYMPTSITYNTGGYGLELFIYGNYGRFNANTKSYDVRNVQLVEGYYPEGIEFIRRSYGEELALCQRYYVKGAENGSSSYSWFHEVAGLSNSYIRTNITFPVTMRDLPAVAIVVQDDGGGASPGTARGAQHVSINGFTPYVNGMNGSTYVEMKSYTADAELN